MKVFRGLLAAALLLAAAARGGAQELPPRLADRFTEGVTALKSGELDAAERAFRDVLAAGGNRAFVHHNLGIVLEQRGRHDGALVEFRAASKLDPSFAPARLMAGSTLLALGRPKEAIPELRRAVRLMPGETAPHEQLATAFERTGDIGGIVDEYRRLVALAPKNEEYAYRLGKAYLKLAQWSYERLRAVDPDSARLSQALGEQQLAQGRPDLALQSFTRAAEQDPSLVDVHLALARLQYDARRWDEAAAEAERALALAPESVVAARMKAAIQAARGR